MTVCTGCSHGSSDLVRHTNDMYPFLFHVPVESLDALGSAALDPYAANLSSKIVMTLSTICIGSGWAGGAVGGWDVFVLEFIFAARALISTMAASSFLGVSWVMTTVAG